MYISSFISIGFFIVPVPLSIRFISSPSRQLFHVFSIFFLLDLIILLIIILLYYYFAKTLSFIRRMT